jgi:hypothetical protein
MNPKLGCLPPVNKPALTLSDFFTLPPTPPVDWLAYRTSWPWWLNNKYGVCVAATWAGVKALVSAKLTGTEVILPDSEIIALYKTQNPGFPAQDGGMDIQLLLEYLQKRGDIVAFGKIALGSHDAAISILGFEWTAITVRQASYDDYNARRDWDYHPASPIVGYHSVMSAGHRDTAPDDVRFETWTRENGFTQAFWAHEVGGTWGVILPEHLGSREFMAGMDLPALAAAFKTFTGRDLPIPAPEVLVFTDQGPDVKTATLITTTRLIAPDSTYVQPACSYQTIRKGTIPWRGVTEHVHTTLLPDGRTVYLLDRNFTLA